MAAIIGCVALSKEFVITTCALSGTACVIAFAGAIVDGIFSTFHYRIKSCVAWGGTGATIAQGFQSYGSGFYAVDSLYCYSTLSGGAGRTVTTTLSSQAAAFIQSVINSGLGVNPAGGVAAGTTPTQYATGPSFWMFVAGVNRFSTSNDPGFTPPASNACFCKAQVRRCMCVHVCACVCMCVHVCVCVCSCVHVCACVCMCGHVCSCVCADKVAAYAT